MDDPGWSWPAWKFGMKREDLTTKLHDQYNTFPSSIQDPEAFHHDVFEVAITASSTDEFHSLLSARKQQRLQELNESLESAAFEIIAHPRLVGTEQWQYALQLFRSRSLDSLVRYFSSYLPESYLDSSSGCGTHTPLSAASSFADYSSVATAGTDTDASSVDADDNDDDDSHDHVPTFLSKSSRSSDEGVFTQEPEDIRASVASRLDTHLPPTTQSVTIDSDSAAHSGADARSLYSEPHRPTSSMTRSFTRSRDEFTMDSASRSMHDLNSYHTVEDIHSPASDADLSDSRSSVDSITFSGSESGRRNSRSFSDEEEEELDGYFPTTQLPMDDDSFGMYQYEEEACAIHIPTTHDVLDSETPTPKPNAHPSLTIPDSKPTNLYHIRTPRSTPTKEYRSHRGESPMRCSRRTPEESANRIQKSGSDSRTRLRGRRIVCAE